MRLIAWLGLFGGSTDAVRRHPTPSFRLFLREPRDLPKRNQEQSLVECDAARGAFRRYTSIPLFYCQHSCTSLCLDRILTFPSLSCYSQTLGTPVDEGSLVFGYTAHFLSHGGGWPIHATVPFAPSTLCRVSTVVIANLVPAFGETWRRH